MLEVKKAIDAFLDKEVGVKVTSVNLYRETDDEAIIFIELKEDKDLVKEIYYKLGIVGEESFYQAVIEKLEKKTDWEGFSRLMVTKREFFYNESFQRNIFNITIKINKQ